MAKMIYEIEFEGIPYVINMGDPEVLQRVQKWEAESGDLSLPENGEITVEKYEAQAAFVMAMLGENVYKLIFGDTRNVFTMMALVIKLSPIFIDAMEQVKALSEQISNARTNV